MDRDNPQRQPTKEPQYEMLFETESKYGRANLGLMVNQVYNDDPKRLLFTLARYKFVAKMLEGREKVLEVGCGDAFGTRLVQQAVGEVTATDFDATFIRDAQSRLSEKWPLDLLVHDFLESPLRFSFDAVFLLDVLEHISREEEKDFLQNIKNSLKAQNGIAIIGMPSLESQVYASPQSKIGQINCKSAEELKSVMENFFKYVFIFSMNDEVVHTGFGRMAHYLFAVCCEPRQSEEEF